MRDICEIALRSTTVSCLSFHFAKKIQDRKQDSVNRPPENGAVCLSVSGRSRSVSAIHFMTLCLFLTVECL